MNSITKKSDSQYAYDKLKQAFYDRRVSPGAAIPEHIVCKAYGVGRTSVRAAFKMLAEEGFVVAVPNRGVFVKTTTRKEISDYFEVRNEIELIALRKSIYDYTQEDIEVLESILRDEREAYQEKDFRSYLEHVASFYRVIIQKSDNPIYMDLFNYLYSRMHVLLVLYDHFERNEKLDSLIAHKKIIEAIRRRDMDGLRIIIVEHSRKVVENLEFYRSDDVPISVQDLVDEQPCEHF